MKKSALLPLILILISFGLTANAQRPKKVALKKNKAKITVAKHPNGKKVVIKKKPRRRVNRVTVAHFHYKHLPRRGAVVTSINSKSLTVNFKGIGYRSYAGIWYRPQGKRWVVVRTPIGVRIKALPAGYSRCLVNSRTYFYYYGTYYIKTNNEYEAVQGPTGAEIKSLPEGYNTLTINGEQYYELDGIYYMPSLNENNQEILVAISNPNK